MHRPITGIILAVLSLGALPAEDAVLSCRATQNFAWAMDSIGKLYQTAHPGTTIKFASGSAGLGKNDTVLVATVYLPSTKEKRDMPGMVITPFAFDVAVIAVNSANPVAGLTSKQVQDLSMGTIKNWKEVGGGDFAVTGISRSETFLILELFEQTFGLEHQSGLDGPTACMFFRPKGSKESSSFAVPVAENNKDAVAKLAAAPTAFSFLPYGMAREAKAKGEAVAIVALDGVAPNDATMRNKTYRFARPGYLLTKGEPTGALKGFVDYILGAEGQKRLAEFGCVPLKP